MRRLLLCTILVFWVVLLKIEAQPTTVVPYIAAYREETRLVNPQGVLVKDEVTLGQKMRASNGNELLLRYHGALQRGTLILADGGRVLDIRYPEKWAVFAGATAKPRERKIPTDTPLDRQILAGIPCDVYPVRYGNTAGAVVGKIWVSVANDLVVKQELTLATKGYNRILTFELSDIKLGQEPRGEQMQIPPGFEVFDSCPTCGSSGK